jgi:hypothetical protein
VQNQLDHRVRNAKGAGRKSFFASIQWPGDPRGILREVSNRRCVGGVSLSCPSDRRAVRAVASRETTAKTLEQTGPERERGGRGRSGRAVGSEREQKVHTNKDGNPLIDGRGSRRRMRGSIGRG